MNPTRIDKEGDVVVLEIRPENQTLRIVVSIIMVVVLIAGVLLAFYTYGKYQELSTWLNPRLALLLMAYFFIFFIFMRHWIWFNRGKEVVVIYPDKLHYYRDFVLFAEGKSKTPYQKLEVIYRKDEKEEQKEMDGNLVDDIITGGKSMIVGFRLDDDKVIGTHLPITLKDVSQLTLLVQS